MESSMQWNQDNGPWSQVEQAVTPDTGRAGNAHKLLGAVSGNLGSTDLLEGLNSSVSTTTARQSTTGGKGGIVSLC